MANKSRYSRFLLLLVGVALVVTFWLATLRFIPYMYSFMNEKKWMGVDVADLSRYGSVGDMFGAINALFSGLALGAIALTLWVESRSRRESRKPLVVGGIDSGDAVIGRPTESNGKYVLPFDVPVSLSNQSSDAALNVAATLHVLCIDSKWSVSIDGPLLKDAQQDSKINILLSPVQWEKILAEITAQHAIEMQLTTRYRSLEGVNWKTTVVYNFSVQTDDQHYHLLNCVRDGTWSNSGIWSDEALVAVRAHIKQGSWDHGLDWGA